MFSRRRKRDETGVLRFTQDTQSALHMIAGQYDLSILEIAKKCIRMGLVVREAEKSDKQVVLRVGVDSAPITLGVVRKHIQTLYPQLVTEDGHRFADEGIKLPEELYKEISTIAREHSLWTSWAFNALLWTGILLAMVQDNPDHNVIVIEDGVVNVITFV